MRQPWCVDSMIKSLALTITSQRLSAKMQTKADYVSVPTMEALRKFYPVAVGIEDHRDPRCCSECGWGQILASTSRKNSGMDLVNFENLKGDVAPPRSLTT